MDNCYNSTNVDSTEYGIKDHYEHSYYFDCVRDCYSDEHIPATRFVLRDELRTINGEALFGEGDIATVGRIIANGGEIFNHTTDNTNIATGIYSHAEGETTEATAEASHAEGYETQAYGDGSHAEGLNTHALNEADHAEGYETIAEGGISHAEGSYTRASGTCSHAEGYNTVATGPYSHAEGTYNVGLPDAIHEVGVGRFKFSTNGVFGQTLKLSGRVTNGILTTNDLTLDGIDGTATLVDNKDGRKNAHTITKDGLHYILGVGNYSGTEQSFEDVLDVATVINNIHKSIDSVYTKELVDELLSQVPSGPSHTPQKQEVVISSGDWEILTNGDTDYSQIDESTKYFIYEGPATNTSAQVVGKTLYIAGVVDGSILNIQGNIIDNILIL